MRHSRHEFATASVSRQSAAQVAPPFMTSAAATKAATTSITACMPVATQLAPMAAAQAASHHFARGQREASNELIRHAHTTWTDYSVSLEDYVGSEVRIRFAFRSDGSIANEGWYVDSVSVVEP